MRATKLYDLFPRLSTRWCPCSTAGRVTARWQVGCFRGAGQMLWACKKAGAGGVQGKMVTTVMGHGDREGREAEMAWFGRKGRN